MTTTLNIGSPAPDFSLYAWNKKEIKLSDLKGKNLVLLFFPLAFTSTCTTELCFIRDNYAIYEKLDAHVLGISVDSLFTLAKYREEQQLNFDLISDFNKEVSKAYDCLYSEFFLGMKNVSKRAAFVVDKNGILIHKEVLENASDLPDFAAINKSLSKN
jgi:glutaredoxin-dependent peroxiredoxin